MEQIGKGKHMNLKKIRSIALAILAASPLVTAEETKQENKKRPNVVFFLVDDFGWGTLSSMRSKFHETPNIDKLAKSGMAFSNGYAACTDNYKSG